jgi:hypothetical protein
MVGHPDFSKKLNNPFWGGAKMLRGWIGVARQHWSVHYFALLIPANRWKGQCFPAQRLPFGSMYLAPIC